MSGGAEGTPRWLEEVREYWRVLGAQLRLDAESEEGGLLGQQRGPRKRRNTNQDGAPGALGRGKE